MAGSGPAMTSWDDLVGLCPQPLIKPLAFPCHFASLGLEPRHVRSPRTPGGLLRRQPGRDAAFNF
jgi:hypothetical protein